MGNVKITVGNIKPTSCPKCKEYFEDNQLLQAEIRHIAAKYGPGAAKAELNEKLEAEHEYH